MHKWLYTVKSEEAQMRLDHLLRTKLHLTRKQISRLKFIEHGIMVNQHSVRTNYIVKNGDEIALLLQQPCIINEIPPLSIPLSILYETNDFIAVHKPSGLTFHPSPGHYYDTLSIQLDHLLKIKGRGTRLYAVGRLDKDTSGIALFAKHTISAQRLLKQRAEGILKKEYLAIVHGHTPAKGTITSPIRKKADMLNFMEVHPEGKEAFTQFEQIHANEHFSLLRVQIKSGRTHQIRVHMQSIHHPIVGDPLYGNKDEKYPLCLFAHQLQLQDPFTEEMIYIEDPDQSFASYYYQIFKMGDDDNVSKDAQK